MILAITLYTKSERYTQADVKTKPKVLKKLLAFSVLIRFLGGRYAQLQKA